MKKLILILSIALVSCQKDKIHIWDKNNDCSKCKVYIEDEFGSTKSFNEKESVDIGIIPESGKIPFCDIISVLKPGTQFTDQVGNPIGTFLYFKCK